ncbi:MAG: Response regulatory protein [Parcubacteria group bacterium]|nr:Response regulatory protein [Parcubacteria group bacterium]
MKILIVEDDEMLQLAWKRLLLATTPLEVIQAFSIEEAEKVFSENSDLSAIAVDACVPGTEINTMNMVLKFRKTFTGPMIAISGRDKFNQILMSAGCNHETGKGKLVQKIKRILNF